MSGKTTEPDRDQPASHWRAVLTVLITLAMAEKAAAIDLGDGLSASWTNTVWVSSQLQFNAVSPSTSGYCLTLTTANCGYGAGVSQERVDLLSELSLIREAGGLHVSLDARRDALDQEASHIELYDAYLQQSVTLADKPLDLLLGRHSAIWGESLFFPANGIAGAQAPIDASMPRGLGYDGTTRFLPQTQLSFSWKMNDRLTLIGYYLFEGRHDRVDRQDAYADNALELANQPLHAIGLLAPGLGLVRYDPLAVKAPDGLDQFGVGLRWHWGDADLGLYGLQYDAKAPTLDYVIRDHSYSLRYATGIDLIGASLALPVGESSLAGELSARHRAPLVTDGLLLDEPAGPGPRGDMFQGQVSLTRAVAPMEFLPDGAQWSSELAFNHLLGITDAAHQLAPGRDHSAAAIRSLFTPQFFQVWPRIDLRLPLSLGYNFYGLSPVLPEMNRGTGDVGLSLVASLDQRWTLSVGGTHYFGASKSPQLSPAVGQRQSAWDDAALTVQTSF